MKNKKINILLLGLHETSIMAARCFKENKIEIFGMDYNKSHLGFHSKLIQSITTPNPNLTEKEWLHFVLGWIKKSNQKFIVIPTSDEFVYLYKKYFYFFKKYCLSIIPEFNVVKNIIERGKQFSIAKQSGLKVPFYMGNNPKIDDILNSNLSFPLVIKPENVLKWKSSINSKGFIIKNRKELINTLNKVKEKNLNYIVQDLIEGDSRNNFEVNILYLPNNKIYSHTIRKLRQYPDNYGTATCIESCSNPTLESLSIKFVKNNKIYGFSNIEFKLNKIDNNYYYIETNPRIWYQINFSKMIGINFILYYYNYLMSKNVGEQPKIINNVKWVDFIPDLLYWKKYHNIYEISLIDFLKSWFPIKSTGLPSISDPIPFLKDIS